MPAMIASLVSAGLSFGGGLLGGESPDSSYRLSRKRGQKSIDQFQRPLDAQHFGSMEQLLRQAMGAQVGGYENALADLSRVGRSSRREAIGQSNQALSQGLQGLSSAGLGSSTLQQNYRTGAASTLAKDLAGIDEQLAGLRSNLLVGKGGAQAHGLSALADLFGRRQSRDAELEGLRYGLLTGQSLPQQQGYQPLDLSGIANFASLFAGGGGAPKYPSMNPNFSTAGHMGRQMPSGMDPRLFHQ